MLKSWLPRMSLLVMLAEPTRPFAPAPSNWTPLSWNAPLTILPLPVMRLVSSTNVLTLRPLIPLFGLVSTRMRVKRALSTFSSWMPLPPVAPSPPVVLVIRPPVQVGVALVQLPPLPRTRKPPGLPEAEVLNRRMPLAATAPPVVLTVVSCMLSGVRLAIA